MPSRKPVPSLQDLCKLYITSHMDFWCGKREIITTKIDDNPISRLPNLILNDLCPMLMQNENLHVNRLNTIINSSTYQLDARNKTRDFTERLMDLTCSICTNLTSLNLLKSSIYPNDLDELTKSIPSIKYLNLRSTEASEFDLFNLGDNSPQLLELDVRDTRVTDIGIRALCLPTKNHWGKTSRGGCLLIEKLYVNNTKVTDKGATTAIRNLPHLRIFKYVNVLRVINNIFVERTFNRKLKLERIYIHEYSDIDITDSTIQAATNLCPNVSRVRVACFLLTGGWLSELANFSHLETLSLASCRPLSFLHHVVPVLTLIGNNLKSLNLEGVDGINLCDIAILCSRLARLFVQWGGQYSSTIPRNIPRSIFRELREVIISCESLEPFPVPSNQLEVLLCNCSRVQVLKFHQCPALNDGLLRRVFESNSLSELNTFAIDTCHDIQMCSVLWMLENCQSLKKLAFINCSRIGKWELIQLQQHIIRNNLDVTVQRIKINCHQLQIPVAIFKIYAIIFVAISCKQE